MTCDMSYYDYLDKNIDSLIESIGGVIEIIDLDISLNESAGKIKNSIDWVVNKIHQVIEFIKERLIPWLKSKVKPVLTEDLTLSVFIDSRVDLAINNKNFDYKVLDRSKPFKKGHVLKVGIIKQNIEYLEKLIKYDESGKNDQDSYDKALFAYRVLQDISRAIKASSKPEKEYGIEDAKKNIDREIKSKKTMNPDLHESAGLTRNEYIASIMLEAADLLREDNTDVLNEALFEKTKSSNKKIRKEVNEGMRGKYDDTFIRDEKDLEAFMDKYGDDIAEISNATKDDIINSRKFTKGKLLSIALAIISAATGMGAAATGMGAGVIKSNADFNKFAKDSHDKFEAFKKNTNAEFEAAKAKNKADFEAFSKNVDDKFKSFGRNGHSSKNESIDEYSTMDESISVVALTVTSILSGLASIVDVFLRVKDQRDLEENIKYLKMIKRKLTANINKVKNPKVRDRYESLIEKINRAEDEYTRKVSVSK